MVRIVPRDRWLDIPPNASSARIATPTKRVYVHHGASGQSTVNTARSYARYHIKNHGWNDIGYNFLIANGKVLEGRGAGIQGAQVAGDNANSHGIVVCGNYTSTAPSADDLDALVQLLVHGVKKGWWSTVILGHRDNRDASTSCPGEYLYAQLPEVRNRVNTEPEENDDMAKLSEEAQEYFEGLYRELQRRDKNNNLRPSSLAHVLDWLRHNRKFFAQYF